MLKKIVAIVTLAIAIIIVSPTLGEAATPAKTTIKYVNVVNDTLNMRTTASANAKIITELKPGTQVSVHNEANGWAKVTASEKQGYVNARYLSATKPIAATAASSYRAVAINVAKSNLGVKYRWGGITPSGFDCSGLVKYSFDKAGKTLPRTAAQMYSTGARVSSPLPGDLLFFAPNKASRPTHVSIYLGNGQMIHSASSKGVSYSSTSNSYWKPKFIGAKRI
ncbi:C40 family peptidase [Peribacillus sp. SCS-155]|uniref:C40 family peptidase n=1 Tax=Peribacillus sedimenti TaxID=3115297 RepID=UPI003906C0D2